MSKKTRGDVRQTRRRRERHACSERMKRGGYDAAVVVYFDRKTYYQNCIEFRADFVLQGIPNLGYWMSKARPWPEEGDTLFFRNGKAARLYGARCDFVRVMRAKMEKKEKWEDRADAMARAIRQIGLEDGTLTLEQVQAADAEVERLRLAKIG